MPAEYDISDALIVITVTGQVTVSDMAAYLAATASDPRYRPEFPRLLLLGDDVSFPASSEIIQYAGIAGKRMLPPGVPFAFVARTPLGIGIASMFMGHAGLGDNYQVFEDETAARQWLRSRE